MDIWFYVHILLTIFMFSIPFWPKKYLKYGVYIPLGVSIIWLIFGGCPLTRFHKSSSQSFVKHLLNVYVSNDISMKFVEHLNTLVLLSITIIGFQQLCKN